MSFIIKFVKGVRNHWKKSTFAAIAITYGINSGKEYYDTTLLLRDSCKKAKRYGREPIAGNQNPRLVTVILNPNANQRKATKNFDNYCAPILNLAGICVDIIQTTSEGHAKTLIETLGYTDAIVVAGGDGTLSEVVTGLLRRSEHEKTATSIPVGVLPLGRSNTVGKSLFPGGETLAQVRSLVDACFAIIEQVTKPMDVMKIELIDKDEEDVEAKPIFAVGTIEWGAFRDAQAKRDKYWYYGPLRSYATYLFNGYKKSITWKCEATINYSVPCLGCSNCFVKPPEEVKRWYYRFVPVRRPNTFVDYSKVENNKCAILHERNILTTEFGLSTTNMCSDNVDLPKLQLYFGPEKISYWDFVSQGWQSEKGETRRYEEVIEAKEVVIQPTNVVRADGVTVENDVNTNYFSIDKEEFEVKPVRITLLPKIIRMYCKNSPAG